MSKIILQQLGLFVLSFFVSANFAIAFHTQAHRNVLRLREWGVKTVRFLQRSVEIKSDREVDGPGDEVEGESSRGVG